MSSHKNVNAFFFTDSKINDKYRKKIDENAAINVKRVVYDATDNWGDSEEDPYLITKFQETKTTWHPIGF